MESTDRNSRSFFIAHVGRFCSDQSCFRQAVVLSISPEMKTGICENLVAFLEPCDGAAYCLNFPGQLLSQYLSSWRSEAESYSYEQLPQRWQFETSEFTVSFCYGGRVDSYQNFIVSGNRFLDFFELENLWRAVSCADNRFHFQ